MVAHQTVHFKCVLGHVSSPQSEQRLKLPSPTCLPLPSPMRKLPLFENTGSGVKCLALVCSVSRWQGKQVWPTAGPLLQWTPSPQLPGGLLPNPELQSNPCEDSPVDSALAKSVVASPAPGQWLLTQL